MLAENLNVQISAYNVTEEIGVTKKEGGSSRVNGVEYIRACSITGYSAELQLNVASWTQLTKRALRAIPCGCPLGIRWYWFGSCPFYPLS